MPAWLPRALKNSSGSDDDGDDDDDDDAMVKKELGSGCSGSEVARDPATDSVMGRLSGETG